MFGLLSGHILPLSSAHSNLTSILRLPYLHLDLHVTYILPGTFYLYLASILPLSYRHLSLTSILPTCYLHFACTYLPITYVNLPSILPPAGPRRARSHSAANEEAANGFSRPSKTPVEGKVTSEASKAGAVLVKIQAMLGCSEEEASCSTTSGPRLVALSAWHCLERALGGGLPGAVCTASVWVPVCV